MLNFPQERISQFVFPDPLTLVVHLYLLFFATLVSATRYIVEHSLLVDQRDIGGWKAFEETVISQKDDLFYKAGLMTSTSGLKQLLAVLDVRFLHSQVWSFLLSDMVVAQLSLPQPGYMGLPVPLPCLISLHYIYPFWLNKYFCVVCSVFPC